MKNFKRKFEGEVDESLVKKNYEAFLTETAAYRVLTQNGEANNHVINYRECIKTTNYYRLVFEYVNGGSLQDMLEYRLSKQIPLPLNNHEAKHVVR